MGRLDELGHVERLQFFEGQRLTMDDLQALEAYHREMRQWHNRSLHQPGIGSGFVVTGQRGDREVKIGPGYAIDSEGREIILMRDHIEQIPPDAGKDGKPRFFDLTVSYPDDKFLEEIETRQGICTDRGVVRLLEEPLFCWVELVDCAGILHPKNGKIESDVAESRRIVLARVGILNCQIEKFSTAIRRNARLSTQPYIACGRIPWPPELKDALENSEDPCPIHIPIKIDTTHADFQITPSYFVEVIGPRDFKVDKKVRLWFPTQVILEEASHDKFTIRIIVETPLREVVDLGIVPKVQDNCIVWMGIE